MGFRQASSDMGLAAFAACATSLLVLVSCSSLSPVVPRGFDLSGDWVLDTGASDAPPDLEAIRRREDRDVVRGRQSDAAASATFAIQDFPFLTATRLTIEQDDASMGIRYDDTTYRDVTWGERRRDLWTIQAGWEEGNLIIRSRRGGTKGQEVLTLVGDDRLRVTVKIETDAEDVRAVRVYRRR